MTEPVEPQRPEFLTRRELDFYIANPGQIPRAWEHEVFPVKDDQPIRSSWESARGEMDEGRGLTIVIFLSACVVIGAVAGLLVGVLLQRWA